MDNKENFFSTSSNPFETLAGQTTSSASAEVKQDFNSDNQNSPNNEFLAQFGNMCPSCGEPKIEGVSFCLSCGEQFEVQQAVQKRKFQNVSNFVQNIERKEEPAAEKTKEPSEDTASKIAEVEATNAKIDFDNKDKVGDSDEETGEKEDIFNKPAPAPEEPEEPALKVNPLPANINTIKSVIYDYEDEDINEDDIPVIDETEDDEELTEADNVFSQKTTDGQEVTEGYNPQVSAVLETAVTEEDVSKISPLEKPLDFSSDEPVFNTDREESATVETSEEEQTEVVEISTSEPIDMEAEDASVVKNTIEENIEEENVPDTEPLEEDVEVYVETEEPVYETEKLEFFEDTREKDIDTSEEVAKIFEDYDKEKELHEETQSLNFTITAPEEPVPEEMPQPEKEYEEKTLLINEKEEQSLFSGFAVASMLISVVLLVFTFLTNFTAKEQLYVEDMYSHIVLGIVCIISAVCGLQSTPNKKNYFKPFAVTGLIVAACALFLCFV